MQEECICCQKALVSRKECFEVSNSVMSGRFICKDCAAEIGINNFFSAGLHSKTSILKKYIKLHPEKQELLDSHNSAKKALKDEMQTEIKTKIAEKEKLLKIKYTPAEMLSDEDLQIKADSFIVKNPGLQLTDNEKCFYQGSCYSVQLKNVITGTRGTSMHFGGKSTFGIHTNSYQREYNRNTIQEKYPGTFYITNKRMVCSAPKFAFEINLTNITSLTAYSDALVITAKDKSYIVETQDIAKIKELLAVSNEGIKRGLTKDTKTDNNSTDNINHSISEEKRVQLLRDYKKLCDDGIITQEEFEAKKKELLSL